MTLDEQTNHFRLLVVLSRSKESNPVKFKPFLLSLSVVGRRAPALSPFFLLTSWIIPFLPNKTNLHASHAAKPFSAHILRSGLLAVLPLLTVVSLISLSSAQSKLSAAAGGALIVGHNSHLVIMEYENWFGPKAVTFQTAAAMPVLQSRDMLPVGGGYDSADPAVVRKHLEWFEYLGMDAALIEVSNNVSCIFNSEWFIKKYLPYCTPAFRLYNQIIRNNTGNTYPAWSQLGTQLKLIPLVGGIDQDVLFKDIDGKTAFEKEIEYFGGLMNQYPSLNVIYEGKPLMLVFLGAAQDPNPADNPLWYQIRKFLKAHPAIDRKYTFKEMAGYLDSQPDLWANRGTPVGPVKINPEYGFWSWVDRLNPSCTVPPYCPYYPSYNQVDQRVENFTASIATAGQYGWGCPIPTEPPYCPDDSLRFGEDGSYATFESFMNYARRLEPIFLIIHQFNEFVPPDEGFDANTDDDIEPANLWGDDLGAIKHQIDLYRQRFDPTHQPGSPR